MEQANVNGSAVKQRIHRSEEEILKHLSDQEESDISVKDYCEMFDINETTFYSWINKYRKVKRKKKVLQLLRSFHQKKQNHNSSLKLERSKYTKKYLQNF
jgi:hypothetical protein